MPITTVSPAVLLTAEGDMASIALPLAGADRLTVIRSVLDCQDPRPVALAGHLDMWLDEEGGHSQPVNHFAANFAKHYGLTWQECHGPVLLTGGNEIGGEIYPVFVESVRTLAASYPGEG
ncbi:DUF3846 domain-containing protein [Streptomyces sp. NPDC004031]